MANIVFIGPQGSGKGTLAKIISEKLKIPHIPTGELLRNMQGKLKEEIDSYANKGSLAPDELVIKILKERIKKADCKNGFILDGFPRNLAQAKILKTITKINKVIEIYIPDSLAIERISNRISCKKCGAIYNLVTNPPEKENTCNKCQERLYRRADDDQEAVKRRLEIYHRETEPILNEYKDILIRVNGDQKIDKLEKEILEKLR